MNEKISGFFIRVEAIIYLLIYNLHVRTFNIFFQFDMYFHFNQIYNELANHKTLSVSC